MAVPRMDDAILCPKDGHILYEVAIGEDNTLGLFAQLRGAAATVSAAELYITRGSTSVSPTVSIATAGEVSATLTAANMTTLGAQIGDVLTGWWKVSITDGATTHVVRFEEALGVSDRAIRFPLDYNAMVTQCLQMGKACAIPSGQSNFWPQVRIGIRNFRNRVNMQQATVKTFMLANEGVCGPVVEAFGFVEALGAMVGAQNTATGYLEQQRREKLAERDALWASLVVLAKDGSPWRTESQKTEASAKPAATMAGVAQGIGGAL